MARKPRKLVQSGVYHIIIRGNNQQNIFYDSSDKEFFIMRMFKYIKECNLSLYAYCLMDNHVHFLVGNANDNMSLFIKKLTCSYVYRFNKKYERSGHLFQGRYISEPIESVEYFKTAYRYILKNPEKAKICSFETYKWNSYGLENNKDFIDIDFVNTFFCSEKDKKNFLLQNEIDSCMENISLYSTESDDQLMILFIKQLFSISNISEITNNLESVKKLQIRHLKNCGIRMTQISRITGIDIRFIKMA